MLWCDGVTTLLLSLSLSDGSPDWDLVFTSLSPSHMAYLVDKDIQVCELERYVDDQIILGCACETDVYWTGLAHGQAVTLRRGE